jgi:hypothetical protein
MFKCIHVKNFNFSNYNPVSEIALDLYNSKNDNILINLEKLLLNESEIFDVNKINNELFSDIKPDIFLSHAHADEEDVIKLAAKIEYHTKLKVFVDSCVWANAYKLLQKIDDKYCYQSKENTYEYKKRNHTTSNVFMILNAALHRVINSSEVLLFLGTDNSVNIEDLFTKDRFISSPWIFSELQFANLVKRRLPSRLKPAFESYDDSRLAEDQKLIRKNAQFAYPTPDSDFDLDNDQFKKWVNNLAFPTGTHELDLLYNLEHNNLNAPAY